MLQKIKEYGYIIAITISLTFVGIWMYTNHQSSKLKDELVKLQQTNAVLVSQLGESAEVIKKDKALIEVLQVKVVDADRKTKEAEKKLADAQKPVEVVNAGSVEEVKSKIVTYYGDDTVSYNDSKYTIFEKTTVAMLYDAESWRLNGPIIKNQLNISLQLNETYRGSIATRDALIGQQVITIADYTNRDALCRSLTDNQRDQITNLNKQLTISARSTKLKVVAAFVGGAVVYYIQDQLRKK